MQKFMAFCLLVSFLVFPVSATGSEYVSRDTFWNWAAGSNGVIKQVINFVGGLGTCSKSDDTYHHASSYFKEGNVDGEVRYRCICDLCGDAFTAYASDLQQSYETQVGELPAPILTSVGSLRTPIVGWTYSFGSGLSAETKSELPWVSASVIKDTDASFNSITAEFDILSSGMYSIVIPSIEKNPSAPTGYFCGFALKRFNGSSWDYFGGSSFKCYVNGALKNNFLDSGQYTSEFSRFDDSGYAVSFPVVCTGSFYPGRYQLFISPYLWYELNGIIHNPEYFKATDYVYIESIPEVALDTTYNIQSRPTSITGDYGIIGDNGQIIKVEGDKIVNETNNTYYNPSTGQTVPITDWSYNYEDRSYTVTTENGDTVTITYGDENVVIKEGDTTYNIYYLVNGSGSENPDPGTDPDNPPTCDHTWTETSRTDPTCSTPGKVIFTCSKCNQTKTETIPATGHSWVVDRTVQTTYDEEGNLLQQGYTIYSCSVCGEQYKDMEGTGPPGPEEEKSIWEKIGDLIGTIAGGFLGLIEAVLGKLLDALVSLAEMLMGKLKIVVETVLSIFDEVPALFGGFLDFLGAIFPFLPPEITTILTFGVIAVVFIGILKAVRR